MEISVLQGEKGRRGRRGSVPGREYKDRERGKYDQTLYNDYFCEKPVHGEETFRRRFRMYRPLFLRVVDGVKSHDSYFVQKRDQAGHLGFSSLQKCTLTLVVPVEVMMEFEVIMKVQQIV